MLPNRVPLSQFCNLQRPESIDRYFEVTALVKDKTLGKSELEDLLCDRLAKRLGIVDRQLYQKLRPEAFYRTICCIEQDLPYGGGYLECR